MGRWVNIQHYIMKRLILLSALLLGLSFSTFAQQALWGGQNIISPEIRPDNSVTFRYIAPKARTVQLTGDFLTNTSMCVDMVEKDGIWEYTTEPLPSELYCYAFVVDGVSVRDPNNVYMIRDVASITNIFIIGNGQGDKYKVQDVPHGSVTRRWYNSPVLGFDRRITIYTPAGYEKGKEKYPVLYLLHGAGGDEEAWIVFGRTAQIMDNLIASGEVKPMIVVMTNGNPWQQGAPGETKEGFYKPSFRMDRLSSTEPKGTFVEAFPDVISFVESNYRVIKKKSGRAIAGLSMGGYHSQSISMTYPNTFDYVGIFSAGGISDEGKDKAIALLEKQRDNGLKLYWIACGKTDFLYEGVTNYRKQLDEIHFPYIYRESEGGHIWRNWRIYLCEFTPMLFK